MTGSGGQVFVGNHREKMMNAIEAGEYLIIGVHHAPGRLFGIGIAEHLILRLGVIHPLPPRFQIHRAQFPTLGRVLDPRLKPPFLLLVAHRKPVFDQDNPRTNEHPLEFRTRLHELHIFLVGTKAHHMLHPRPVVPTAVEEDNLTRRGEMRHVALKVPLRLLALGRGAQGHHAGNAGIEAFGDPLDHPPPFPPRHVLRKSQPPSVP